MKNRGVYSLEVKREILENLSQDTCCNLSFLSAVLRSSEYNIVSNGLRVIVSTKVREMLLTVAEIIKSMYGFVPRKG